MKLGQRRKLEGPISNEFLLDVKQARLDLGYSQYGLARDLGVTSTSVAHWEAGRRTLISFESAVKLAALLGLDLNKYKENCE